MKTKVNGQLRRDSISNALLKFEAIKDILHKKLKRLELISDTQSELNTAIINLSTYVSIRIAELDDKIQDKVESIKAKKADIKALSDSLNKLETNLTTKSIAI